MKAVSYLRCSGASQVQGDSFPRQRDAISACAQRLGYELAGEYVEEAVPGKTELEARPQFQEMVAALLSNGCRTVIVENLSRLAREYRVQEQLLIYLATKDISLIAADTGENITEAMNGDPMKRALVQIQGVLHELDKNMLVAKLTKARNRKRESGGRAEGRFAYGFHPLYPEESKTLELIQSLYTQGNSFSEIARKLTALNYKSRDGKPFHNFVVSRIVNRST